MDKRELSALMWGSSKRGCNTLFKYVPIGGHFKFGKDDDEVFVKTKSGYKSINGGRTFRTGQLTAVYHITDDIPRDHVTACRIAYVGE